MLKSLALGLIRLYQRHLSPRKGFSCAYRVHTGGHSCSHFGYSAIAKHGVLRGLVLIRRRLDKCAWQHNAHRTKEPVRALVQSRNAATRYQGGFVEGCDVCADAGACDSACACDSCYVPHNLPCSEPCASMGCNLATEMATGCVPPRDCGCGAGQGAQREQTRLDALRARREPSEEAPSPDSPED